MLADLDLQQHLANVLFNFLLEEGLATPDPFGFDCTPSQRQQARPRPLSSSPHPTTPPPLPSPSSYTANPSCFPSCFPTALVHLQR